MKLGPRSCSVCPGGTSLPCVRCRARDEHTHLAIIARDGASKVLPVCRTHADRMVPELRAKART